MQLFDSIFQNAKCCRSDEKVYFGINFTFLGILQEGADSDSSSFLHWLLQ